MKNLKLTLTLIALTAGLQPLHGMNTKLETASEYSQATLDRLLFNAVKDGDAYCVQLLLVAGADINAVNNKGHVALLLAAGFGHTQTVKILVEHGADINTADISFGRTALFWAALNGHTEIVKLLIEHGADLNHIDKYGTTVLDAASHHDIIIYLRNCYDYFFHGSVKPGQNPNLTPSDVACAALAVRNQNIEAMRNIIPMIPNFNFDCFIKLTVRENLVQSNHELCHLKLKLTREKHDSLGGREAALQQGMLQLLKSNYDSKFNFTNLQKNNWGN